MLHIRPVIPFPVLNYVEVEAKLTVKSNGFKLSRLVGPRECTKVRKCMGALIAFPSTARPPRGKLGRPRPPRSAQLRSGDRRWSAGARSAYPTQELVGVSPTQLSIHSRPKKCFLGCVNLPLRPEAESRNLWLTLLTISVPYKVAQVIGEYVFHLR